MARASRTIARWPVSARRLAAMPASASADAVIGARLAVGVAQGDPAASIRTPCPNFAGGFMRAHRSLAAGASHRPRQSRRGISGEIGGRDRGDPARRVGQSRPRRRRVRPSRPALGLRHRPPGPGRAGSSIPTRARTRLQRLRDDGKPALIFAAHLANWELAAVGAQQLRPRHARALSAAQPRAVSGRRDAIARRLHGHADADRPRRAAQARRSAGTRLACRHAGRSVLSSTASR